MAKAKIRAVRIAGLIDYFTLALTHGLMAIALWRLLFRADLDEEDAEGRPARRPWAHIVAKDEEPGAAAQPGASGDA